MSARYILPSVLFTAVAFTQSSWLEWNAGCPEGSEPLVLHNGTWAGLLTFDVELRGLLADTVTVDFQNYLRFSSSPGTVPSDVVGFPELPVVRRMVWLPDDSDVTLEYSVSCSEGIECLPVYPAPLDSLVSDSTCTPYIGEYFRLDSAAYASTEWYPDTLARLVGEFRLRDLRVGIVDVCPVQYLASEDSLRVWSDIEVAISYDTTADWPGCGLGCYEALVGDRLLGYHPDPHPWAPVPGVVMRPADLVAGPARTPDYVILVASGLDGWWVDTLAHHRADLDGFDVAIARTDSVLSQFGGNEQAITSGIIRDFTEAMWDWGSAETKRPSYLLLIGDHEDPAYAAEAWFLPTYTFEYGWSGGVYSRDRVGNDGWFVYFDDPRTDSISVPDMMVGRLPARDADSLHTMVEVIRSFESPVSWPPGQGLSWRRDITRLAGGNEESTYDEWQPSEDWTDSLSTWLDYDMTSYYCGDGESETQGDGSAMSSADWEAACREEFEDGSQIIFYTNHGDFHMFSAGLDFGISGLGAQDSSFDNLDVDSLCISQQNHGWPFALLLCCSAGTFNHTAVEHDTLNTYGDLCFDRSHTPPRWDFGTDCLAEALIKNTTGGAIGVFAGSLSSGIGCYARYGEGILEAMYCMGAGRTGDAVQSARLSRIEHFTSGLAFTREFGQFNLLGDPAVDISDRVRFRDRCDLIVSPLDFELNRYPTHKVLVQAATILRVGVRNAGAVESGGFDIELRVVCGNYDTLLTSTCAGLDPDEESLISFRWLKPTNLYSPFTLALAAEADPDEETPDSWFGNNGATGTIDVLDMYPNETGWPIPVPGSVFSVPALGDVDGDDSLEIVVQAGSSFIVCAEPEGSVRWVSGPFDLRPVNTDPSCRCEPALGSVCGDSLPEVVFFTRSGCFVLEGSTGEVLYSREHGDGVSGLLNANPRSVVLADLVREGGQEGLRCEIVYVALDTLYVLRVQNNALGALDREHMPEAMGEEAALTASWCVACDLDAAFPAEIVIDCAWNTMMGSERETSLLVYSFAAGRVTDSETWEDVLDWGMPAVGELAGEGLVIAQPRGVSDESNAPAYILDTSLALVDSCEKDAYRNSSHVRVCGMTDWDPQITGIDRIVAAPENIAFSWRSNGALDIHPNYPWTTGNLPPFFALGDLDGDEIPDLLTGRREGWLNAYRSDGSQLGSLEFPFTLPANLFGGFAIADIDGDENVEVIFGTSDNFLHVWELADCDEGYAPWPQCQQNAARTGVLE